MKTKNCCCNSQKMKVHLNKNPSSLKVLSKLTQFQNEHGCQTKLKQNRCGREHVKKEKIELGFFSFWYFFLEENVVMCAFFNFYIRKMLLLRWNEIKKALLAAVLIWWRMRKKPGNYFIFKFILIFKTFFL